MNQLQQLKAMGLVLPGPAYLFGAIVFGLAGYVAYRRGRKTARPLLTWGGLALMLYPYAVSQAWLLWVIGIGICGWLYSVWN